MVAIEEPPVQTLGQLATDSSLAGPHQADEIDVGTTGHVTILAAERKWAG